MDTFHDARALLSSARPALVVFGVQPRFDEFCRALAKDFPDVQWILCTEKLQPLPLIQWINAGFVAATIPTWEAQGLEGAVQKALDVIDQTRQQEQLVKLFAEQTHNLQQLTADLEVRVQKRQKQLSKSQKQLSETNAQMEMVHRALLAIYRAKSVRELERALNEVLNKPLLLDWTRILFVQQSSLLQQNSILQPGGVEPATSENVLPIDIPLLDRATPAKFVLAKRPGEKFSSAEAELLSEISEAVSLALQRMQKLDQAETLKQQWEATFDSISHPLCLTTDDFKILRMNRAFALAPKKKFKELLGQNCFEVMLGKKPVEAPTFPFRSQEGAFEISGQPLQFELNEKKAHLILFRDITEEHRIERRILETTKLAELGTIGSSIAHELNNPLGGMLSFLQLIKMDLSPKTPLRADVEDMEKSTLNCRDIIRNLLSFARKSDSDDHQQTDLHAVIERAIKLIELQSKSKGIRIDVQWPHESLPFVGSVNTLSQALCNILQNSIDAISEQMQVDPLYPGHIKIQVQAFAKEYRIEVIDNGAGIRLEHQKQIFNPLFTTRDPGLFSGMGLTTAFSIISEHAGRLEISSQTGSGTTATISLARPDLASKSQVFDGEI